MVARGAESRVTPGAIAEGVRFVPGVPEPTPAPWTYPDERKQARLRAATDKLGQRTRTR